MKQLNMLLALLISIAIGLAVLESGLRLIFPAPKSINRFDAATGWSMAPSRTTVRNVDGRRIEFAINAEGLRDDAGLSPATVRAATRVIALGDSFTLGFTVPREEAYVDLLERRWRAEQRDVEVVNAGNEGWSTDQEAVWLRERGLAYRPNLVLLFPYENDLYWNGQERYTRYPKPRFAPDGRLESGALADPGEEGALARSAIARSASLLLGSLAGAKKPGELAIGSETGTHRIAGEFVPLLREPPPDVAAQVADWTARTEGALIAARDACKSAGARLVIVPIPSKSAIDADEREFFRAWSMGLDGLPDSRWSPDQPVETFLGIAKRIGVDALDPRAALAAANRERKLYFEREKEWHLNTEGNRVLASFLHEELDRLAALPPAVTPVAEPPAAPVASAASGAPRWPVVFAALWLVLSGVFAGTYADERNWKAPLKVGAMLGLVFAIILGGGKLVALVPHAYASWVFGAFVLAVLGFVAWKLGRRIGTILELLRTFVERGHWYLMPLLVVLLTVGSLLVVAASSPLIAPFIYTLF
jgi:hypothetical protein